MLSESGSVTLQPRRSRITVQDRPEVVAKVAEALARLDRKPAGYRLRVELLEGTSAQIQPEQRARVEPRLRRMFHFPNFRRIGAADFEGDIGDQAMATLGSGYRISFVPETLGVTEDSPYHIPDPGTRLQLQSLVLERAADGGRDQVEVLRTRVVISPKQEVYIGAGGSEEADHGLVLILKALPGGDH
jgi:hypothetical protein